ncbi:hypothetical protein LDENG_00087170 [Lucifuga dentata]|nr:hypothetical protein LDENG_00087170 [Lucifuga dentata]
MVVVNKEQKRTAVISVAIPNDGNIRKKEQEKPEKYQGLKEELDEMWKVKSTVVTAVTGAIGALTPKVGEVLQQLPGKRPEVSVQKSAVLEQLTYFAERSNSQASGGGPQLKEDTHTHIHTHTHTHTHTRTPPERVRGIYIYIYIYIQ